jgi:TPR repeat protein
VVSPVGIGALIADDGGNRLFPVASRRGGIVICRRMFGAALAATLAGIAPVAWGDGVETGVAPESLASAWPADLVRVARAYLERYPQGSFAEKARAAMHQASRTAHMLQRREVRLFRADFQVEGLPEATRDRIRQAALGDKEAALQVAQWHERGDAGLPRDTNRYVGWLQYAAALGHPAASYELALHYRREDQPALAAPYEARAEELGYQAPPTLDNVRK